MRNESLTHYHRTEIGQGSVDHHADAFTLHVPSVGREHYHDAQIADYTLGDRVFRWQTPKTGTSIRLRLRAQFNTSDVRGTAGFGFWNHPFSPEMRGLPRLPQAAWFFYGSPPNNMSLAKGVAGHGWKCATINAQRWQFLTLAPFALPGVLMMRVPWLYRILWPVGQYALGIQETVLPPDLMTAVHSYMIEWNPQHIDFFVDERRVMRSPFRLAGRMGFIAWVDNQYAIVTPQGRFGWGLVEVPQAQTLTLQDIHIEHVSD